MFLLVGAERCILLDTGCAPDPDRMIFPYLRGIGLGAGDIDMVINTHCDLDHCGGNYAVKRSNPQVEITCGEKDRALIEDPRTMWERRYNAYDKEHGIHYDEATRREMFEAMGNAQPVDRTWKGGETIELGDGWHVEIHHTPGHSVGHLSVFDPRSRTLLSGDAVQGSMYPDVQGHPVLCPTYLQVEDYINTAHYIESLPVECLATCHWPLKRANEVQQFLAESLAFVRGAEQLILSQLLNAPGALTLRDLISNLGPTLGSWPRAADSELVYALAGHLDLLVSRKQIFIVPETHPAAYRIAGR
ncbi:MAG: MBL fold metallo-hydrolase [Terriglobia bacterium]